MLVYIFKSTAILGLLLLFYKLFLEQENMHTFKRFYLLGAFALAFLIPFITFVEYVEIPVVTEYTQVTPQLNTEYPVVVNTAQAFDLLDYLPYGLWSVYVLGLLFFGFKFTKNLSDIVLKIRKNPKYRINQITNVLLSQNVTPHTFFSFIFLNKHKYESKQIPHEVLLHEETHAKQKHSVDVILIEFIQVLFWFNPLIYLLKKAIKLNHEFLADRAVINNGIQPTLYQQLLLEFSSNPQQPALANAINYSSIKKRFTVMKTQTSKKSIFIRSLLLLPLLALLIYGFSETEFVPIEQERFIDSEIDEASFNPLIEDIKKELEKVDLLQVHYIGASDEMMAEYSDFINDFKKTKTAKYEEYQRVVSIYKLMSAEQKSTVEKYPDNPITGLKISEVKTLTLFEYESYKNKNEFAVWLDGRPIENRILNSLVPSNIVYHSKSFVYKNARSSRFPQEYQVNLYTEKGYERGFIEKRINKYKNSLSRYNKKFHQHIQSKQLDNPELRLQKLQLEEFYERIPVNNRIKYNLSAPPEIANAPSKNHHGTTIVLISEDIEIRISNQGKIFVQNRDNVTLKNLSSHLRRFNEDLTKEQRANMVRAVIMPDVDAPIGLIKDVEAVLTNYGVALINIVGPNPTSSTEKTLNKLLKPNQNISINYQEGATKSQLKEYNTLALKYNRKLSKDKSIRILKSDIERLEHLHGIMTHEQRENAQPFPDFPEPPPAPEAPVIIENSHLPPPPIPADAKEEEKVNYEKAIRNYEKGNPGIVTETTNKGKRVKSVRIVEDNEVIPPAPPQAPKVRKGEKSNIPPPPPVPRSPDVEVEPTKLVTGTRSLDDKTIYYKTENGKTQYYNRYGAPVDGNGNTISIPPPPPPKSPMDHVIEMAKKDAVFYFDGKKISSDKAIAILKKNESINLRTKHEGQNKPTVELSTKPIIIKK